MLYVVHLDGALVMDDRRSARHYIGFTDSEVNIAPRMDAHARGDGSRFLAVANERGIAWHLVAIYKGTRVDERLLKNHKHSERFCPRCRQDIARNPRAGTAARRIALGLPEVLPVGGMQVVGRDLRDCLRRLKLDYLYEELKVYE